MPARQLPLRRRAIGLICAISLMGLAVLVFASGDPAAAAITVVALVVGVVVAVVLAPADALRRLGLPVRPSHDVEQTEGSGKPVASSRLVRSIYAVRERLGAGTLARQATPDSDQLDRLLVRVQNDHADRLAQILHPSVHLILGLDVFPDAVTHGLDPYLPRERSTHSLPSGTTIREVFREAGDWTDGRLLILGEPGAGKTTMLLELAQTLASESETDGFRVPCSSAAFGLDCDTRPQETACRILGDSSSFGGDSGARLGWSLS
jgi:hypothetical protein